MLYNADRYKIRYFKIRNNTKYWRERERERERERDSERDLDKMCAGGFWDKTREKK